MSRFVTPLTVGTMLSSLLAFALLVTGAPVWLFAVGGVVGLFFIRRYTRRLEDARRRRRDDESFNDGE